MAPAQSHASPKGGRVVKLRSWSRRRHPLLLLAVASSVACRADVPREEPPRTPQVTSATDTPAVDTLASARDVADTSAAAPPVDATPVQTTLVTLETSGDGPLSRVVGGLLTEREIVLAEASTARLHFYDRTTGRFVRSAGRPGSGPGEFRQLARVQRVGQAIYVWDWELRRLSVWSVDGTFLRTVELVGEPGESAPEPIGVFADGTVLAERVVPGGGFSAGGGVERPPEPMVIAPRQQLSWHAADGAYRATLRAYRGSESFVAPNGGGGATVTGALFGRQAAVAVSGSTFVVLSSEADSVVQYASDGTVCRRLRPPPSPAVRVQRADVQRERARLPAPQGPLNFTAVFDRQTPPTHFPAFGWNAPRSVPLASASDGSLWLLRYGGVRSRETVYLRFSPRGELLDSLQHPTMARLLDADGDLVLLATADADGAEQVVLIRRERRGTR